MTLTDFAKARREMVIATIKRCLKALSSWQVGKQEHLTQWSLIAHQLIKRPIKYTLKSLKSNFLLKGKSLETASRSATPPNLSHRWQSAKSESFKTQKQLKQWVVVCKTKFLRQTQSNCLVKHLPTFRSTLRSKGQKIWKKKMARSIAWSERVWSRFPSKIIVFKTLSVVLETEMWDFCKKSSNMLFLTTSLTCKSRYLKPTLKKIESRIKSTPFLPQLGTCLPLSKKKSHRRRVSADNWRIPAAHSKVPYSTKLSVPKSKSLI